METSAKSECPRAGRLALAVVASVAMLGVLPGFADASTVSVSGTTIVYTGADAPSIEANAVTVAPSGAPNSYQVSDPGATITASSPCVGGGGPGVSVTCSIAGLSAVNLSLAGGNDSADTSALAASVVTTISAGNGNDGPLIGGLGPDIFGGGTGIDGVSYAAVGATNIVADPDGNGDDGRDTNADGIADENDNIGTDIENLTGANGSDRLTGSNSSDNLLVGGGGNDTLNGKLLDDTLIGGGGGDTYIGGGDTDTASFAGSAAGVTASLLAGTATGEGSDSLTQIENLIGTAQVDSLTGDGLANVISGGAANDAIDGDGGTDTLHGDAGDDLLSGGPGNEMGGLAGVFGDAGDDTLNGNGGDDALDGGANTVIGDTASFTAAPGAVTADLAGGTATGDGSDTLATIENLSGSGAGDTLSGDAAVNTVTGGVGDDTINGAAANDTLNGGADNDTLSGSAGMDKLTGGTEVDTASYASAAGSVTANLTGGSASADGDGSTDTLATIENLTGSANGDTLTGSATDNTLLGGSGADTLSGNDGIDIVNGEVGDDVITGDGGDDLVDGGDDVDAARGGSGNDTVTGGAGDDQGVGVVNGGIGDDIVRGGLGDDLVEGDDGNDILSGNAGTDALDGGADTDTASYLTAAGGATVSLTSGAATADGDGASDNLIDLENIDGSGAADTLTGSAAVINILNGNGGADLLDVRDSGGPDVANCGAGIDTVRADAIATDTVNPDCEVVDFAGDPDTTIDSGPSNPTNDNTPTFAFSSSEAGSTFECKVDAGAFAACTSPFTTSALADGTRTFQVRAVDNGSNLDPTPAAQTFTVDTATPATPSITASSPASPANNNSPRLSGTAAAGTTVKIYKTADCSGAPAVTGSAANFASPGLAVSVGDDSSTAFRATTTSAASNVSACSAPFTYVEDSTAPDTVIDSGPPATGNDSTPTFSFHSTQVGSTFECQVDAAAFAACTSPLTTATLADGSHTVQIRAIDAANSTDGSPASQTFTVQSAPPRTRITLGPKKTTVHTRVRFAFRSPDAPVGFECRLDDAAFAPCTSPTRYRDLALGKHRFQVRAINSVANFDRSPATRRFTVVPR